MDTFLGVATAAYGRRRSPGDRPLRLIKYPIDCCARMVARSADVQAWRRRGVQLLSGRR